MGTPKINNPSIARYLAWVPCLSGRLLFQQTSCDLWDTKKDKHLISYIQESSGADPSIDHYVIISSIVNWRDSDPSNNPGKFRVILMAHRKFSSRELSGNVYFLPDPLVNGKRTRAYWEYQYRLIEKMGYVVRRGEQVSGIYSEIKSSLDQHSCPYQHQATFAIRGNGLVFLEYVDRVIEGESEINDQTKMSMCRKAFYYVKYAWHKHKHHHKSTDSLTTIHECIDGTPPYEELINDLRDSLVRLARSEFPRKAEIYSEAQGLAIYGRSLVESLRIDPDIEEVSEDKSRSYSSFFDNMVESNRAKTERLITDSQKKSSQLTFYLAILGTVLSFVGLQIALHAEKIRDRIPKSSQDSISEAMANLFGNPYHLASLMLLLALAGCIIRYWDAGLEDVLYKSRFFQAFVDWRIRSARASVLSVVGLLGGISLLAFGLWSVMF